MALQHKISDAQTVIKDVDASGKPVVEIVFRFVRYRLTIDDKKKAEKLLEVLQDVLSEEEHEVEGPVEMPTFYKKGKGNG